MKAIRWLMLFIVLNECLTAALLADTVTLTWTASSGVVSNYFVERSVTTTNNFVEIATIGPVTTYADTNLTDNTSYWYRVRAGNEAGRSPYSNIANKFFLFLPGGPGTLTVAGTKPAVLNWQAASGTVSHYYVERAVGTTNTFVEIAALPTAAGPVTSYSDGSVEAGVTYWYRVRAGNPRGRGPYTNIAGKLALSVPGTPGTITITITP
jgi:predicted phage tail protein